VAISRMSCQKKIWKELKAWKTKSKEWNRKLRSWKVRSSLTVLLNSQITMHSFYSRKNKSRNTRKSKHRTNRTQTEPRFPTRWWMMSRRRSCERRRRGRENRSKKEWRGNLGLMARFLIWIPSFYWTNSRKLSTPSRSRRSKWRKSRKIKQSSGWTVSYLMKWRSLCWMNNKLMNGRSKNRRRWCFSRKCERRASSLNLVRKLRRLW
jgi:hypothetical protein